MSLSDSFRIEIGIMLLLGLAFYISLSAGMLSAPQVGFMAAGAYTSALLAVEGWSFWAATAAALLLTTVLGMVVASVGMRLSGFGLAIVTIGFSEVVRISFNNFDFAGGALGLIGIPLLTTLPLVLIPVAGLVLLFHRLESGYIGRSFAAMRADVEGADALGVPTRSYRWLAIAISGPIAGYAGVIQAFHIGYLDPSFFDFGLLVTVATAVVLGGRTTVWGAVAGILFMTFVPEVFRFLDEWRQSGSMALLALVLLLRPEGLITRRLIVRIEQLWHSLLDSIFRRSLPPVQEKGGA